MRCGFYLQSKIEKPINRFFQGTQKGDSGEWNRRAGRDTISEYVRGLEVGKKS